MSGKYLTSFDGAKLYYQATVRNKKKWLIFLHGLGGDLTAWQKERQYFEGLGLSTAAMDLRGHGFSERRDDEDFYKLENFAKDIVSLIEAESIESAVVVGHCFGGMVSIYFEAEFPTHSKGLVLVDTSYKPTIFGKNFMSKTFFKQMIHLLSRISTSRKISEHEKGEQFFGSNDINLSRFLSDIEHTSLKSYLMMFNIILKVDVKEFLKKIKVPTLVIEGTKDSIFPPELAKELSRRIKKSQLELIEGANHIIVLNNPEDLENSIGEFIKKIGFLKK